ncbi:hypothetical protein FGB62_163g068 [Gracilaria domingensis]|nr:hypothetical protein FGB62_163g068 [Gracilaria domingensis]
MREAVVDATRQLEFASAPALALPPRSAARVTSEHVAAVSAPPRRRQPPLSARADNPPASAASPSPPPPPPPAALSQQQQPRSVPPPTPKKPRAWAVFRRSSSTLAAAFSHDRSAVQPPRIASQAEFRRTFLRLNRHRLLRDVDGDCFRLHPIVMNGDCGFASIAKGINLARHNMPPTQQRTQAQTQSSLRSNRSRLRRSLPRLWRRGNASNHPHKRTLHAKDIRNAMYHEIRKAKKTYLGDRDALGAVFSDHDFDRLERDVGTPGIAGHWLGTVLGVLEHVIIAHAMNVNIFLYQFDLQRQSIRRFESAIVHNPDCDVYLFFTGPATSGHFDTLVKIPNDVIFSA